MKLYTTILVALLATIGSATEQQGKKATVGGPPTTAQLKAEPRQGRGMDFLAPFRSFFGGRPRGPSGPGKQYGVKPSETQSKPHTATPFDTHGSFKPNFPNFNEGFGGDFHGSPSQGGAKPVRPMRHLAKYPHAGPHPGPQGPQGPHPGPPGGHPGPQGSHPVPQGGHPGPQGGHPGPQGGPPMHYGGFEQAPQHTYHTYAEPQTQHHHYHAYMNGNGQGGQGEYNGAPQGQEQYTEMPKGGAPVSYDAPKGGPAPYDAPQGQYDGQAQNYYPQEQSYDSPQPAQQFNRPVSQPGPSSSTPAYDNNGFTDFGGFGPSNFGQGPAAQGSAQGGFFGGNQNYPEQYEEQTRNTREPEIITADYQNQGQEAYPYQGGFQGAPQGSQSYPESYSAGPAPAPQASGPIIKSHPLRASAAGHRPSSYNGPAYGSQGESRPQPFLYRPVSSSIRVPGAVDEDAVYAPPTPAPFRKPEGIVALDSPKDTRMKHSASFQNHQIVEPDAAASGHHGHGHDHGLESANGDRILYHVSGHQGPYSYRFGYDTGKGYNRMFRFEEKDGKGYVTGKYGFYDKTGKLNVVNYQAHPEHGYHAERDHGNVHQTHSIKH